MNGDFESPGVERHMTYGDIPRAVLLLAPYGILLDGTINVVLRLLSVSAPDAVVPMVTGFVLIPQVPRALLLYGERHRSFLIATGLAYILSALLLLARVSDWIPPL
jgi:hypothetical protein